RRKHTTTVLLCFGHTHVPNNLARAAWPLLSGPLSGYKRRPGATEYGLRHGIEAVPGRLQGKRQYSSLLTSCLAGPAQGHDGMNGLLTMAKQPTAAGSKTPSGFGTWRLSRMALAGIRLLGQGTPSLNAVTGRVNLAERGRVNLSERHRQKVRRRFQQE